MLKINIICVGGFKENYLKNAESEYLKRITRFFNIETTILKESNKEKEGKEIMSKLSGYSILLDVLGTQFSSYEFAEEISKLTLTNSKIAFIIGGSNGVSDDLKLKVNKIISFGKITLPHQLAKVLLLEQIYRAGTIINNIKYHK